MKNKTLAIFGIGAYILRVIASAEDLEGNFVAPIVLIAISGIATVVFTVMATIRLWKEARYRYASIMLASSTIILFVLTAIQEVTLPKGSSVIFLLNITKVITFLTSFYAIFLLWAMAKYEGVAKKLAKDSGLTSEELSLAQEDLRKGNRNAVVQRFATAQERQRQIFKEATGIDVRDIIPLLGKDISWADIVNHVFRVLDFDRGGTIIEENGQVKALSSITPYGYLLVESPILNQKATLPIIHRDDFLLAASVFDVRGLVDFLINNELLVTYSPKIRLPKGLAGSPHHVLHYVIAPRGTLDSYYSMNNDMHMAKPDPQKLFGPFVYQGEGKVQINPEPKL